MGGEDPDYSKRELWEKMERGEEVEWTANVQIMKPEEADANVLGFDPFDVTKVWPRDQFPVGEPSLLQPLLTSQPIINHTDSNVGHRCTNLAASS